MKKATLTIGLFTLVMVLTSFTTPGTITSRIVDNTTNSPIDGSGGQDTGGNRKVDYTGDNSQVTLTNHLDIDGSGGQDTGGNRKVD
ncbi:3-oxoacyl-ACP reductase [Flavobacterium sp. ZT3R18]|uniref:3-oxoacyl-ACP reductase n=1 Tax=Flavobacterium sp. ZT3R18 TaxID=2594429 RepID=UPI00117A4E0B|nr:3-oxoacyl-ACP reductase [Flavobacterium sp. ZT3R18]TRX38150.1 3-oxoacyl-ACP reductase [Flavobacterium sp. ZT3R18]